MLISSVYLGNDIVDLTAEEAQGKAESERFFKRSCTEKEIALCQTSTDPHRILWTLWAMKEATYKALKKENSQTSFIPREFECSSLTHCIYKGKTYPVRISEAPEWVHAIALVGDEALFPEILSEVVAVENPMTASQEVRALALRILEQAGCAGCTIERRKEGSEVLPPQVYCKGKPLGGCDLSLSHDGRFVATAVLLFL